MLKAWYTNIYTTAKKYSVVLLQYTSYTFMKNILKVQFDAPPLNPLNIFPIFYTLTLRVLPEIL